MNDVKGNIFLKYLGFEMVDYESFTTAKQEQIFEFFFL